MRLNPREATQWATAAINSRTQPSPVDHLETAGTKPANKLQSHRRNNPSEAPGSPNATSRPTLRKIKAFWFLHM